VFPLAAISRRDGARMSWQVPAVVSWAGARGVVPLAAALSIPLTPGDGTLLPHRDLVQLLTTAVIVLTLVVQGFTLAPLVRLTGIARTPRDVQQEHSITRAQLTQAALDYLDELQEGESAPDFAIDQLRRSWTARLERIKADDGDEQASAPASYRQLRRDLLAVESAELDRLHSTGEVTDSTRRRVQRILDLEQAGLTDDLG
jgi:CPA1 family monovalent cation:H+ antiporter